MEIEKVNMSYGYYITKASGYWIENRAKKTIDI